MANKECRIEFYFKKDQLLKMLEANPYAKGVIVSQQLIKKKQGNGVPYSLVLITARVDKKAKPIGSKKARAAVPLGVSEIDGCPYPPGCG